MLETEQETQVQRVQHRSWYRDWVLIPMIGVVFALDQVTKVLIRHYLYIGESLPAEGIFRITNTYNTGSAFGLFRDQTVPLIFASFVGVAILFLVYRNSPLPSLPLRLSLGLQLGGALGNLVDRVSMGYVTDFIALGFWPVFNVADISIVVGLIILAYLFTFSSHPSTPTIRSEPPVRVYPDTEADISPSEEVSFTPPAYPENREAAIDSGEEAQENKRNLTVDTGGDRLDVFLASQLSDLSRSRIHQLIKQGHVLLNQEPTRPAQKIQAGDHISITVPPPEPTDLIPQDIPLTVVYRDDELLVIDKPAGLTVHPGPGHPAGTLVNALLALEPSLPGIGGVLRPGIVHRLDKDTSGLMVVAKSDQAHRELSRQLKAREVTKGYQALVKGKVEPLQGTIVASIGRDPQHRKCMAIVAEGREAETRYRVLQYFEAYTLLEVFPKTGRTHQIRVHFSSRGHPLAGDNVYGGRSPFLQRHFLHAHLLGFHHPKTGQYLEFTSPLPPDLQVVLEQLWAATSPIL